MFADDGRPEVSLLRNVENLADGLRQGQVVGVGVRCETVAQTSRDFDGGSRLGHIAEYTVNAYQTAYQLPAQEVSCHLFEAGSGGARLRPMLRLDDYYLWDSWIADDGDRYHLFVLQAPRSLGDPAKRHVNATIGHATSRNLVDWEYLGECLGPAESGFDDLAIWTGSVVREGDHWRMFYTAVNTGGFDVYDQRVGSAISDDLHHWTRANDAPVVGPDRRWYKTLADAPPPRTGSWPLEECSETWRDPLAFADPDGDGWHLLIAARSNRAGKNDDGVVAHAYGPDLDHLAVGPPLCEPGAGFGQLEVLQNKVIDGRPVLVFTCHPHELTAERVAAFDRDFGNGGYFCTWSLPSPGPLGPWDITLARPFVEEPELFAAPLVQQRDGSWVIIGFRNLELKGIDAFDIIDPIPVTLDAKGYLVTRA
jgi:beta-fructofuranosidase